MVSYCLHCEKVRQTVVPPFVSPPVKPSPCLLPWGGGGKWQNYEEKKRTPKRSSDQSQGFLTVLKKNEFLDKSSINIDVLLVFFGP